MVVDNIVGKQISALHYADNMLCINIGNEIEYINYKGQNYKTYEYSLNIQAPWRITKENKISATWADGKELDEIESFLCTTKIVSIDIAEMGDLKVVLNNGYVFEVFVDSSKDECWRLVSNGEHLVCYGNTLELN